MTCAGIKEKCFLKLKSVLLKVSYIRKWPKFAYLELKFRIYNFELCGTECSKLLELSSYHTLSTRFWTKTFLPFSLLIGVSPIALGKREPMVENCFSVPTLQKQLYYRPDRRTYSCDFSCIGRLQFVCKMNYITLPLSPSYMA